MNERELGKDILRPTLCKTGRHVWVWASSTGYRYDQPANKVQRCDCGLFSWEETSPPKTEWAQMGSPQKKES